jgi:hypothetical protein
MTGPMNKRLDQLEQEVKELRGNFAKVEKSFEAVTLENQTLKKKIKELEDSDLINKRQIHDLQGENWNLQDSFHCELEKKEVNVNKQRKTSFWVKSDKKSDKTPKDTVKHALHNLTGISLQEMDNIMTNAKCLKQDESYHVTLNPKATQTVTEKLGTSNPKNSTYSIRNNLCKVTRVKKGVLGRIANKLNEKRGPHTACVPKLGTAAVLYYQPKGRESRLKLTYSQTMDAFSHVLSDSDKKEARSALPYEPAGLVKVMLLL